MTDNGENKERERKKKIYSLKTREIVSFHLPVMK